MSDAGQAQGGSDRPKRDAAKKFLNGNEEKREERRKTDNSLRRKTASRSGGESKDSGDRQKRLSGGGGLSDNEKRRRLYENLPKLAVDKGIRRLDMTALKKYKRHFGLRTAPTSSSKEDLQAAVIRHFACQLRAEEGKTERKFISLVREQNGSA
mmetsp:Transcript_40935/g.109505  ORF Transcript_40935/g.109505 Transcript_40935/m.109505 type:complete len:154 (-) Transcript_40935:15-476(-)